MSTIRIPWAKPIFFGKEQRYVADAVKSTWISGGPYVERFEKGFASAIQAPYVVSTSNGTTALLLAMMALGIGAGDEVIIPGFSFVAPANMAIAVGATPVFVDIDPMAWCIDPKAIEAAITNKTKAICAVHLYGNVCDMSAIMSICKRRGLLLIEDNAESTFSKYNGIYAGTFADAGTFSFQATKTLAMGEGGCVVVKNKRTFERTTIIRNHGMDRRRSYWHTHIGHNFRLPNLQAAMGCAQLESSSKILGHKQRMYASYCRQLKNMDGIVLQQFRPNVNPVVWAVALRIDPYAFGRRDKLMAGMLKAGIETRPGFYPFSTMPLYKRWAQTPLQVAREVARHVIVLPSFAGIREEEIDYVCSTLARLKK